MSLEIEVKAKIDDIEAIEKKLIEQGAVYLGEVIEEDHYFNSPVRDFSKSDETLRVRITKSKSQNPNSEITYKGPKLSQKTKTRKELTVNVDDTRNAIELFHELGFTPVTVVMKIRRKYKLNDIYIFLDRVEGLGAYIELEYHKETDIETGEKVLIDFLKSLGIEKMERRSYLELLLQT